jgi:hypothetical protein
MKTQKKSNLFLMKVKMEKFDTSRKKHNTSHNLTRKTYSNYLGPIMNS